MANPIKLSDRVLAVKPSLTLGIAAKASAFGLRALPVVPARESAQYLLCALRLVARRHLWTLRTRRWGATQTAGPALLQQRQQPPQPLARLLRAHDGRGAYDERRRHPRLRSRPWPHHYANPRGRCLSRPHRHTRARSLRL